MKRTRYIILLLLFLGFSSPSTAQVPELLNNSRFRTDARAAVDSIYNFNFSGAEQRLRSWKERSPQHPVWTLLEGMAMWWEVLSDLEDTSGDEEFFNIMKKANYEAGKLLHDHPSHLDALIIKAISNGYIARQHANRSEWVTSLNYAREAMNAYEYLLELQPDLPDLKLAEGLKLYYSAYLPEAYPIVQTVSWFLPEGDKKKGLNYIQAASEEAVFARAEATYFLGNINYNYEKNYTAAVQNFERLQKQYPNNNYYTRILVKSYYQRKRYGKALAFINRSLERWQNNELSFSGVIREELLTWKGRILEHTGRESEALACYRKSFGQSEKLSNTQHRSFYVVSGYLAGKLHFEQGDFEKARNYLKKVRDASAEKPYRERAGELLARIEAR